MTLVLEIGWAQDATTVTVVDTAAHTKVGEGRSAHADAGDGQHDPTTWWAAMVDAARYALDGLSSIGLQPAEVRTVVVGAGDPPGGLLALGPDGEAVHPALLGSHTGSGADADWLIDHVDGGRQAWVEATGTTPTAGSAVALLSWLHRSAPDAWAAADRFTLPAGWLLDRLGGDFALGSHDAVGTGVLDLHGGREWRTDLLAVVDPDRDWRASLPTVVTAAEAVGLLSPEAAAELGLPPGLPLHAGTQLMEVPPTS